MTDESAASDHDERPLEPTNGESGTIAGAEDTSNGIDGTANKADDFPPVAHETDAPNNADDAAPVVHETDAPADEDFRRYWNSLYRVMTMAGAALVLVLGIAGALISRTLSPAVPAAWTVFDLVVTAVLFVWYIMGMRCHLDLHDDRVVVSTKARTVTIPRADIESINSDSGWWSAMQPSGRTVVITCRDNKKIKSYGALPTDALGQARVLDELQAELGRPTEAAARRLDQRLEATLAAAHVDDRPDDQPDGTAEDTSG